MSGQASYSTTLFNVAFSAFSVSSTGGATAFDIFSLKASSAGRVEIREINLGQGSSNTSANQQLAIALYRGSTALGGAATVTPINLKGWSGAPTAGSSATAPSSNLASTASAILLMADATDLSGNWDYRPDTFQEIILEAGQSFNVRVSAPPISVPISATLTFREGTLK